MTPTEALAIVVAGENAAVYAYGLLTPRLSSGQKAAARAALDAHRLRRDAGRGRLIAGGATPPAAAAAYDPPFPVTDAAAAVRLAAYVEDRLAGLYAVLASATAGEERRDAALAVQECAVRAVSWGGAPTTLVGFA